MSNVLNRTTKQYLVSVNTPDYPETDWIINPDLSKVDNVPLKYWDIKGDTVDVLDQAAKDVVDAAALPAVQAAKARELSDVGNFYIDQHYDSGAKTSLLASWIEGNQKGYANRAAMVQSVWEWAQQVLNYYAGKMQEIFTATKPSDVAAITWDFSQFDASDPALVIFDVQSKLD